MRKGAVRLSGIVVETSPTMTAVHRRNELPALKRPAAKIHAKPARSTETAPLPGSRGRVRKRNALATENATAIPTSGVFW